MIQVLPFIFKFEALTARPNQMSNTFFLLVLPQPTLTIHVGSCRNQVGFSLRGSCVSAADAAQLALATQHVLEQAVPQAWVDCQGLHSLTWLGQRALMEADRACRAVGTTLYWCGLSPRLLRQLHATGLEQVMRLLPAELFGGPRFLLPAVG